MSRISAVAAHRVHLKGCVVAFATNDRWPARRSDSCRVVPMQALPARHGGSRSRRPAAPTCVDRLRPPPATARHISQRGRALAGVEDSYGCGQSTYLMSATLGSWAIAQLQADTGAGVTSTQWESQSLLPTALTGVDTLNLPLAAAPEQVRS